MAEIASLAVADPPGLWAELGFALDGTDCWVSGIRLALGSPGSGLVAWSLREAGELTELPLQGEPAATAASRPDPELSPPADHPNGVVGLDHLVATTPDIDRTITALETARIHLRRTRRIEADGRPALQAFFRMGETVLEVVGPQEPTGDGPAAFYGLAFTVENLEHTAGYLGDRLLASKIAVQPGRRIATLARSAGSSVAVAFLTPSSPR